MILQHLFPTTVGIFEFDRDFTLSELEYISNLPKEKNDGNLISINRYILNDKFFSKIKIFILDCVSKYFQTTVDPEDEDVFLDITQSWFNYNQPNDYHHRHLHPNSFISGVLYLKADPEFDKIFFYKDDLQIRKQVYFLPKIFNIHNSESWWIPVHTGKLILFPSWLQHSVQPVGAKEERISLSFNTFPKGTFGTESTLTRLTIL